MTFKFMFEDRLKMNEVSIHLKKLEKRTVKKTLKKIKKKLSNIDKSRN